MILQDLGDDGRSPCAEFFMTVPKIRFAIHNNALDDSTASDSAINSSPCKHSSATDDHLNFTLLNAARHENLISQHANVES